MREYNIKQFWDSGYQLWVPLGFSIKDLSLRWGDFDERSPRNFGGVIRTTNFFKI